MEVFDYQYLWRATTALLFFGLLAIAIVWLFRRRMSDQTTDGAQNLTILQRMHLGPKHKVILLSFKEHYFLVGLSPSGMTIERVPEQSANFSNALSEQLESREA